MVHADLRKIVVPLEEPQDVVEKRRAEDEGEETPRETRQMASHLADVAGEGEPQDDQEPEDQPGGQAPAELAHRGRGSQSASVNPPTTRMVSRASAAAAWTTV